MDFSEYRKTEWLKGKTILIAEDEPDNYRLMAAMLKHSGAELEWAKDGNEVVSLIRNKTVGKDYIILMDIKMPYVDGFEALRLIRETDKTTPVIAVTAYAQAHDRDRILNSNFDAYIAKPVNLQLLVKVLKDIIDS